jgi:hypothetical protein
LVSHSAKIIEVESGCTMRLVSIQNGTPTDVSVVPRRSLVLAASLVASSVSMVALAPSRRDAVKAPLTPATRRGRSPAEGAAPNPLILGLLFRLIADRCDDLGFPRSRVLDVCGRLALLRRH